MSRTWLGLRQELADLVLPVGCAGCGRPCVRARLCEECSSVLNGAVPRRVRPSRVPSGLPQVYGALTYTDEARAALLAHKERGALGLAAPLGAVLARAVERASRATGTSAPAAPVLGGSPVGAGCRSVRRPASILLVPVPSMRRAVAGRGHDPVRRMAREAAAVLRGEGMAAQVLPVLCLRRRVVDQAGLSAAERTANLAGALEMVPGGVRLLGGGRVVLVDDVMTTGATLAEASRALGGVAAAAVLAVRSVE
ncbi:Predicted amidophosphoribosyltransferases [Streptomyces qinglanensis]|uniref:Predicted amidophosphoribosyltransferases n=1 Tax=Streptomyces qinglanensis TaxID=943816 RepID=A0A1H9WW06_9ACTN|nr:Predicted amidophosphoribosyltransferases [Streptomyces qinglanensis]